MALGRFIRKYSWLSRPRKYRTALPRDDMPPAQYCREAYFLIQTEAAIRKGGKARAILAHVLWRMTLPFFVANEVKKYGPAARKHLGIGQARQWWLGMRLCGRIPVTPQDLYAYRFFPNAPGAEQLFFNYHGMRNFISDLASGGDIEETAPLLDKASALRHALGRNLPFHDNLASHSEGRWHGDREFGTGDIFVKELRGTFGIGAMAWRRNADGSLSDNKGRRLSVGELRRFLEERGSSGWVVQERLENHPAIRSLCGEALATLRVVTVLNEKHEPELGGAVLRMPSSRESVVDNFSSGGIAAAVDLETGVLGAATAKTAYGGIDVHPVTGASIRGFAVPRFAECVALAIRAHEAFRPRIYVGWDIAITPSRLVIVEGNGSPDVDLHQIIDNTPLGEARLGKLLKHHVREALRTRNRRQSDPQPQGA